MADMCDPDSDSANVDAVLGELFRQDPATFAVDQTGDPKEAISAILDLLIETDVAVADRRRSLRDKAIAEGVNDPHALLRRYSTLSVSPAAIAPATNLVKHTFGLTFETRKMSTGPGGALATTGEPATVCELALGGEQGLNAAAILVATVASAQRQPWWRPEWSPAPPGAPVSPTQLRELEVRLLTARTTPVPEEVARGVEEALRDSPAPPVAAPPVGAAGAPPRLTAAQMATLNVVEGAAGSYYQLGGRCTASALGTYAVPVHPWWSLRLKSTPEACLVFINALSAGRASQCSVNALCDAIFRASPGDPPPSDMAHSTSSDFLPSIRPCLMFPDKGEPVPPAGDATEYFLDAVVCHGASHYVCYVRYSEATAGPGGWVLFDDKLVRVIGTMEDVSDHIKKSRFAPTVLLFQLPAAAKAAWLRDGSNGLFIDMRLARDCFRRHVRAMFDAAAPRLREVSRPHPPWMVPAVSSRAPGVLSNRAVIRLRLDEDCHPPRGGQSQAEAERHKQCLDDYAYAVQLEKAGAASPAEVPKAAAAAAPAAGYDAELLRHVLPGTVQRKRPKPVGPAAPTVTEFSKWSATSPFGASFTMLGNANAGDRRSWNEIPSGVHALTTGSRSGILGKLPRSTVAQLDAIGDALRFVSGGHPALGRFE
ncbi:hypothetical protein FNF31_00384 [Cafeteria roenbergensis]|uniref:USP domain-containing protein n=1 Tax=Cafeteria roenbergensis TaxID=33653 RepID=A0A5A8DV15_CAFRO|nr:hypothetical protein FNF31_00384 [Cafeteria roenbergensis]